MTSAGEKSIAKDIEVELLAGQVPFNDADVVNVVMHAHDAAKPPLDQEIAIAGIGIVRQQEVEMDAENAVNHLSPHAVDAGIVARVLGPIEFPQIVRGHRHAAAMIGLDNVPGIPEMPANA